MNNIMKVSAVHRIIGKYMTLIATVAVFCFTACAIGDGDAMDSYRGSDDPLFTAIASDGYSYVSKDGKAWTRSDTLMGIVATSITYGDGTFIAAENNTVYFSSDGRHWYDPGATGLVNSVYTLVYGKGLFLAGSLPDIYYSSNGLNWTAAPVMAGNQIGKICYGNGRFFAIELTGGIQAIHVSKDGINWELIGSASGTVYGLAYGNTLFVIVGTDANRTVYLSPDGTSGSFSDNVIASTPGIIYDVAYGDRRFVAVADGGEAYVSENGFVWDGPITVTGAGGNNLTRIRYGNGIFVAVGTNGTIVYSPDGRRWSGNAGPGGAITINDICFRP